MHFPGVVWQQEDDLFKLFVILSWLRWRGC